MSLTAIQDFENGSGYFAELWNFAQVVNELADLLIFVKFDACRILIEDVINNAEYLLFLFVVGFGQQSKTHFMDFTARHEHRFAVLEC